MLGLSVPPLTLVRAPPPRCPLSQTVLKLQWKLVTISELFNDVALPRKVRAGCHSCVMRA